MKINALIFFNNDIMIPHNKPTLGIEEEKVKIIDNVRDAGPTYNQPLMRAERKLRDLLKY